MTADSVVLMTNDELQQEWLACERFISDPGDETDRIGEACERQAEVKAAMSQYPKLTDVIEALRPKRTIHGNEPRYRIPVSMPVPLIADMSLGEAAARQIMASGVPAIEVSLRPSTSDGVRSYRHIATLPPIDITDMPRHVTGKEERAEILLRQAYDLLSDVVAKKPEGSEMDCHEHHRMVKEWKTRCLNLIGE